jgi:hypothetical protein
VQFVSKNHFQKNFTNSGLQFREKDSEVKQATTKTRKETSNMKKEKRNRLLSHLRSSFCALAIAGVSLVWTSTPASAGTFIPTASEPFGTFGDVQYVRYTGRFVGTTAPTGLGAYRMAFEIVAPANPALGNGTVLIEPPHSGFGSAGRDVVLGRDFVFGHGFSYATVGFGTFGLNILDPTATDLILAGQPVGNLGPDPVTDFDILVQFVNALESDPFAVGALGSIERKYGYGVSQTSGVWQVVFHRPGGQGLLDFTLLHIDLWRPVFIDDPFAPELLEILPEEFTPLTGIGKVIWVESEGDQLISAGTSAQLRRAVVGPDADPTQYRLYEVAGAPHFSGTPDDPLPPPFNPLARDVAGVVRAMFLAGDQWVHAGTPPPPSALLAPAPPGAIDPVYGFETGIARDANLNALGGIRFPDVEVGRAWFIASLVDDGIPLLVGLWFDLQCVPPGDGSPRFTDHGDYVSRVVHQANALRNGGYLLEADAEALKQQAAESEVGKPGTCSQ